MPYSAHLFGTLSNKIKVWSIFKEYLEWVKLNNEQLTVPNFIYQLYCVIQTINVSRKYNTEQP